jgi:hypothetical protein
MNQRIRRKRRRGATAAIAGAVMVSGWLVLTACSNQAEGERCQTANNSDDCQDGLICLVASQVNPNYNQSDRCCPVDRSQATHPACTLLQNPVAGDSAPPPDTGPVGPPDTGVDTSTPADAGIDADDAGDDAGDDAADAADQ